MRKSHFSAVMLTGWVMLFNAPAYAVSNGRGQEIITAPATFQSSATILAPLGLGVTYGINAGTVTLTGAITATGLVNASQSVELSGTITTFAANGAGVVLLTQTSDTNDIATITGCSSGAVGQGQKVTFVSVAYTAGAMSFTDTAVGTATADSMVLNGAAGAWAGGTALTSRGSSITLLCTTIDATKRWIEVGRSLNGD